MNLITYKVWTDKDLRMGKSIEMGEAGACLDIEIVLRRTVLIMADTTASVLAVVSRWEA